MISHMPHVKNLCKLLPRDGHRRDSRDLIAAKMLQTFCSLGP